MRSILGHIVITTFSAFLMVAGAHAQVVFTDITEEAGIALTEWLTESAAWGDYDNDGDEDLYLTVDGPNHLFRNDGGGRFTDVTETAGVGNAGFSVGTAFGDLDNDGDLDLYVVNFSGGLDVLYRNDGPVGPGARIDSLTSHAAGTNIERSSRGMAFVDYDRDGLLDIFVMAIGPNILYRQPRRSDDLGTSPARSASTRMTRELGSWLADINDDGWPDLFTGNRSSDFSNLYVNQGGESLLMSRAVPESQRVDSVWVWPPSTSTTTSIWISTGLRGRRSPTPCMRIAVAACSSSTTSPSPRDRRPHWLGNQLQRR